VDATVLPDWQQQQFDDGILREPGPDKRQLVLWLPRQSEAGARCWERISSVAGAAASVAPGIYAVAAVGVRLRQAARGVLGKLFRPFRRVSDASTWLTPNGDTAELLGERRTDLLLVWTDAVAGPLDESVIQAQWPQSERREKLGPNLFLVAGAQPPEHEADRRDKPGGSPTTTASAPPTTVHPRQQAQEMLEAARRGGDRLAELTALLDLGAACHRTGDPRSGATYLEEALTLAKELGDRSLESDVLGNLALAVLGLGQPGRALELIEAALACARASGDRFQIKASLDAAGDASSGMRQPQRALAAYSEALALARELGDRPHQAELLWRVAIQHAELGDRAQALANGQAAIDLLRELGNPQVEMLSGHLHNYAAGSDQTRLPAAPGSGVVVDGWSGAPVSAGPGPLRMAFAALKSMARFVGSGMKTLPPQARTERLATCTACPHHTGVRCRLCGCFTAVKTWLPHERCPIEKWPK
jgi:tetratricopeptide (TPR) repeat protein